MNTDAFPTYPAKPAGMPLDGPLRFFHITSPAAALAILRSRTFYGTAAGRAGAGVTGWLDSHARTGTDAGTPAQCGAILHFVWHGEILPNAFGVGAPNALYDERPGRVFVPAGTQRNLKLDGVELEDGHSWTEGQAQPGRPVGRGWLKPGAWRDWLHPQAAMADRERALVADVARLVACRPYIVVAPYQVGIERT